MDKDRLEKCNIIQSKIKKLNEDIANIDNILRRLNTGAGQVDEDKCFAGYFNDQVPIGMENLKTVLSASKQKVKDKITAFEKEFAEL